jgi:Zn-dependent protease/CBS domain-containing protein
MRKAIRLGTIFGIAFTLDYSWFVVFILGTWSLARQYLPDTHPGWSLSTYWVFGAIISALFFASVAAHELAHAFATRAYGAPVRDITLFSFGGTPHSGQEPRLPHEEVLIALAGLGMSLALATLFYEWWRLGLGIGGPIHALAGWLAWLNLMVFLVNLIPAFPLDGGRIFRAVIWDGAGNLRRATVIALAVGRLVALGVIFYGSWLGFWQLRAGSWGEGLWIAVAGWLLHRAITQSEQQTALHDRNLLAGYTVRDAMLAGCPRVLRRLTLDIVTDQIVKPSGHRYVLVVTNHQFDGLLSVERIEAVSRKRWPVTRVEDVMLPVSKLKTVHPDVTLTPALERMATENERQLVVVDDERPLGVVTRDTVLRFLDVRAGSPSGLVAAHA